MGEGIQVYCTNFCVRHDIDLTINDVPKKNKKGKRVAWARGGDEGRDFWGRKHRRGTRERRGDEQPSGMVEAINWSCWRIYAGKGNHCTWILPVSRSSTTIDCSCLFLPSTWYLPVQLQHTHQTRWILTTYIARKPDQTRPDREDDDYYVIIPFRDFPSFPFPYLRMSSFPFFRFFLFWLFLIYMHGWRYHYSSPLLSSPLLSSPLLFLLYCIVCAWYVTQH